MLSFTDPSEWFKCPWIKKDLDEGKENSATPWGRIWHIWWRKCYSIKLHCNRIFWRWWDIAAIYSFLCLVWHDLRFSYSHPYSKYSTENCILHFVYPFYPTLYKLFAFESEKHFRFSIYILGLLIYVSNSMWRALRWCSPQEHLGLIKYWWFQREVAPKCFLNPHDFFFFFLFLLLWVLIHLTLSNHVGPNTLLPTLSVHNNNSIQHTGLVFHHQFYECNASKTEKKKSSIFVHIGD